MSGPSKRIAAQRAAENSSRAKWSKVRFRDDRLPETKKTALGRGCWCGKEYPHDWEGKDEGSPHPTPMKTEDFTRPVHAQRNRVARLALQSAGVCPVCLGYPKIPEESEYPSCNACLGTGAFPPPRAYRVQLVKGGPLNKIKEEGR